MSLINEHEILMYNVLTFLSGFDVNFAMKTPNLTSICAYIVQSGRCTPCVEKSRFKGELGDHTWKSKIYKANLLIMTQFVTKL